MQQRCDCNNRTFRRCSSCSVAQRRRRATCLRTSASLCPSVDHTSSRCRLTLVHSVVIPSYQSCMIRFAQPGVSLKKIGFVDARCARMARARHSSPRDQRTSHRARHPLYSTWHAYATVGHLPFTLTNTCKGHTAAEAGKCSLGQLVTPGAAGGHLLRRARSIDTRRMPTFHLTPVLRTDVLLSPPFHQSYVLQLHAVSD